MDRNLKEVDDGVDRIASPSSRRAWIEIYNILNVGEVKIVALLAEGVDRNSSARKLLSFLTPSPSSRRAWIEIISNNSRVRYAKKSPSSRRAWIEISFGCSRNSLNLVALLAEGVDRNRLSPSRAPARIVSPSSRRAWIEISGRGHLQQPVWSPSSRRAWIEI